MTARVIDVEGLRAMVTTLREEGYDVVAPTITDGAIGPGPIEDLEDLPAGWGDEQGPGSYDLHRRDDDKRFGYAVGPGSWKQWLFPPHEQLLVADRRPDGSWTMRSPEVPVEAPMALLGVRPCEVAALAVHDRVLLADDHHEPGYARRRHAAFVVAVSCADPAATCFCASVGTGPAASPTGADLAMTEVLGDDGLQYVVEAGSAAGDEVLGRLDSRPAEDTDLTAARSATDAAAARQTRRLDLDAAHEVVGSVPEHLAWDEVAARCLGCTSCTMVCPTCFCHTVEDRASLTGDHAERWRRWDSCFSIAFTETAGSSVRVSTRSRYRQWLSHKVSTWWEQFGTSGCVGCGRCITWCPVGIDLTEQVPALTDGAGLATALGASLAEEHHR
ncbi:MAG: 4Fe-4S dicluster domain-containing protein [Acidimicrobiales bacterium]